MRQLLAREYPRRARRAGAAGDFNSSPGVQGQEHAARRFLQCMRDGEYPSSGRGDRPGGGSQRRASAIREALKARTAAKGKKAGGGGGSGQRENAQHEATSPAGATF